MPCYGNIGIWVTGDQSVESPEPVPVFLSMWLPRKTGEESGWNIIKNVIYKKSRYDNREI